MPLMRVTHLDGLAEHGHDDLSFAGVIAPDPMNPDKSLSVQHVLLYLG